MSKINRIRMKVNKSDDAICKVCGSTRKKSLELFDIAFTDKHIITVCDKCNDRLFDKTLKASCYVNHKLKSKKDLAVISTRKKK